jgi:hypothetical protein
MSEPFTKLDVAPDSAAMLNAPGSDYQASLRDPMTMLTDEQEFWVPKLNAGDTPSQMVADTFIDHTTLALYSTYTALDALLTEPDLHIIGDEQVMARIREHAVFTMAMSRMMRAVTQEGSEAPTEGMAVDPGALDTIIDIEAMQPRLGGLHLKNNVLLSLFGIEEPIVELPFDIDGSEKADIPPEPGIWLEGKDVFVQLRCPARPTIRLEKNVKRDFKSPLWKADYTTARPYLKARFGEPPLDF